MTRRTALLLLLTLAVWAWTVWTSPLWPSPPSHVITPEQWRHVG